MSTPKANRIEIEERIRAAETLMVQRVRMATVVDHLVRAYGVTERQAQRYCERVRERWASARPRDLAQRDARRDEIRATIDEVILRALTRKIPAKDERGATRVEVDEDGQARPVLIAAPDLRAALHGLRLAIALDALEEPAGRSYVEGTPATLVPASPASEALEEDEDRDDERAAEAKRAALAARLKGQGRILLALPGGRRT